jgi:hypothetical protein
MDKYRAHLDGLDGLVPLQFPSLDDFDGKLYPKKKD